MKELSEISGSLESKEEVKPGVYHSRLFGFIQHQTYRLRESVGLGLRQVKVSVQWTGQILLSPLRWFDRFKQNPDQQIAGQDYQKLQQLPPTPTKPRIEVESILAEVAAAGYGELQMPLREDWSVVDAADWDTTLLGDSQLTLQGASAPPQRTKPVIRGLASLLVDRSLVLVDRYNQILDVLSPSQQFHLQRQIDPVLAKQWSIDQSNQFNLANSTDLELTAADQLLLNSVEQPRALPPAPTTTWQKLGYWLHYYREYLWIDSPEPEAAGQLTLSPSGAIVRPTREFTSSTAIVPQAAALTTTKVQIPKKSSKNAKISAQNLAKQRTSERSQEWEIEGGRQMAPTVASSKVVFTPEWIETPTSNLGYDRSIFVRLMEWLDRLILAVENWLIEIFQRFFQSRR
jgi:hypothetical protein